MKKKLIIIFGTITIITVILFILSTKPKTTVPLTVPIATPSAEITLSPTEIIPIESIKQTPDDYKYSQALVKLNEQYPWYSRLPIETKDFRIIYDFDKNSFRIRILTESTEVIKQSAVAKLKEIGVDLNKFTYYFIEP